MPSASETMATAVTKGVLKSVRKANLRLRINALDEPRCCGVYRLGGNALGLATSGSRLSFGDRPSPACLIRVSRHHASLPPGSQSCIGLPSGSDSLANRPFG